MKSVSKHTTLYALSFVAVSIGLLAKCGTLVIIGGVVYLITAICGA